MALRFILTCYVAILSTSIVVIRANTETTTTTTTVNMDLEANRTANYLRHDLPKVLLHIFLDTYINLSNTIVVVPGCILEPTKNIQSDILDSLLVKTSDFFVLEIQTDFSLFDRAAVGFLWFIDSRESFQRIFISLYENRDQFSNQAFYTVVFVGHLPIENQIELASDVFSAFWADSATNVLFLTSDEQRTTLYTYFVYSNDTCGSPQTVAYNYYWHKQQQQQDSEEDEENGARGNDAKEDKGSLTGFQFNRPLFPKKCHNLFNCSIKLATFPLPPFMILTQQNNGTQTYFDGIEGIVVRVLSQRLHFNPVLTMPDDEERWGTCNEERTNCTGVLKLMLQGRANLTIGLCGTNTFRGYDSLTSTISYFMVKVVFAVPRGRPVSNLEKLMLPFKYIIWSCIVLCFGTGLLLILALKLFRQEVRQFVVGRHNPHPAITMVSVWLGNSVNRLPGRNFSRFLLMMWILLAFVLRSAYQGALFDILRLKKTISPVNTVQKMADAQYDIYVSIRMEKYLRQMDASIQPLIRVVPTMTIDDLLMATLETTFGGVVVVPEPTIQHFNKFKAPDGFQLIHSPLGITTIQNTIYVDKTSCLLEAINQELWMYLSSGLIHSWTTKFLKDYGEETGGGSNYKAMALADVMGIFQVYAFLMGVVVLVFMGEVVYFRVQEWRERKMWLRNKIG